MIKKIWNEKYILYLVLLFYAAMDGWRDAWIGHDWLARHVVKWVAYFSLPVYVLAINGYFKPQNWKMLLWLAAGGFFFWETFYMLMQ